MLDYKTLAETFDYKRPTQKIFAGRTEEIKKFSRYVLHPGGQIAVYGDRSIGKTSFVRHVLNKSQYLHISCEPQDTFQSIFKKVFAQLKIPQNQTTKTKAKAGVGSLFGGEMEVEKSFFVPHFDPDSITHFFSENRGIDYLFFDEFDLIKDAKTKSDFALLMKFFSDRINNPKIIIAGIAEDITDLIAAHASTTRFLGSIHLKRMDTENLSEIMHKGEQILEVKFSPALVEKIVTLSEGLPFFTHLLSFGVLESFLEKDLPVVIDDNEFENAINYAYENANSGLKERYKKAIDSGNKNSEISEQVLWACAENILETEVQTKDILGRMQRFQGSDFKQQNLSNYLGRFDKEGILFSARKGRWKFRNPLMKIFVNVARRKQPSQSSFFPS